MSVTVLHGDCRAVLPTLDAGSVQCCVTSPPYYGLRDYGVAGQIGLEPTPDEYVAEMVAVFREVRRVLRDDGTLWLNIGDSYASSPPGNVRGVSEKSGLNGANSDKYRETLMAGHATKRDTSRLAGYKPKDLLGIPWLLAFALRADGWYLRSDIIWHKPNPMPESVRDRPTSAHEHVFLLTKAQRYFYDADAIREPHTRDWWNETPSRPGNPDRKDGGGRQGATETAGSNARNVWTIATQPFSGAHFATMPPDLAERCIKAGTSEKGCCPHCGAPWARSLGDAVIAGRRDRGGVVSGADAGMYSGRAGASYKPTLGWQQTCHCPEHTAAPCTVLDPFGGAGTTGLVADRLNRNAVLVELNPEYRALAQERITDDAPLLARSA